MIRAIFLSRTTQLSARSGLIVGSNHWDQLPRSGPQIDGLDGGSRWYSKSTRAEEEGDEGGAKVKKNKSKKVWDPRAIDYNNRREAYLLEVSKLRKQYFAEATALAEAAKAERERKKREIHRKSLERQRLRNIKSAQNALRQEEFRREQVKKHEVHLAKEKVIREEKEERFRKVRQLAIDELEKEAHLWLSTPQEIETAFTPDAMQLLWGRPQGYLGSPNPSPDTQFWQHEAHFYKMPNTYKAQREYLLDHVEDNIYEQSNLDPKFWTPERLKEHIEREERARLRADVQLIGRKELLKKQAQMIDHDYATEEGEVPKPRPSPSLKVLANNKALEAEGSRILLDDPTKFFEFDERSMDSEASDDRNTRSKGEYVGPTQGAPIGLKKIGKRDFPLALGKIPEPDTRSEKQKKQEEREQSLLAAAQEGKGAAKNLDSAAEDGYLDTIPDINYDDFIDPDTLEWEKGVDPDTEEGKAILAVEPALRMKQEDVDWVVEQLKIQDDYYDRKAKADIENYQAQARSRAEFEREERKRTEGETEETLDDELERIALNMPYDELATLISLDSKYAESPLSDEEVEEAAKEIPSFSLEKLKIILARDRTFVPSDPPKTQ